MPPTLLSSLFSTKIEEWIQEEKAKLYKKRTNNTTSISNENKYIRHHVRNVVFLLDEGAIEYFRWNGGLSSFHQSWPRGYSKADDHELKIDVNVVGILPINSNEVDTESSKNSMTLDPDQFELRFSTIPTIYQKTINQENEYEIIYFVGGLLWDYERKIIQQLQKYLLPQIRHYIQEHKEEQQQEQTTTIRSITIYSAFTSKALESHHIGSQILEQFIQQVNMETEMQMQLAEALNNIDEAHYGEHSDRNVDIRFYDYFSLSMKRHCHNLHVKVEYLPFGIYPIIQASAPSLSSYFSPKVHPNLSSFTDSIESSIESVQALPALYLLSSPILSTCFPLSLRDVWKVNPDVNDLSEADPDDIPPLMRGNLRLLAHTIFEMMTNGQMCTNVHANIYSLGKTSEMVADLVQMFYDDKISKEKKEEYSSIPPFAEHALEDGTLIILDRTLDIQSPLNLASSDNLLTKIRYLLPSLYSRDIKPDIKDNSSTDNGMNFTYFCHEIGLSHPSITPPINPLSSTGCFPALKSFPWVMPLSLVPPYFENDEFPSFMGENSQLKAKPTPKLQQHKATRRTKTKERQEECKHITALLLSIFAATGENEALFALKQALLHYIKIHNCTPPAKKKRGPGAEIMALMMSLVSSSHEDLDGINRFEENMQCRWLLNLGLVVIETLQRASPKSENGNWEEILRQQRKIKDYLYSNHHIFEGNENKEFVGEVKLQFLHSTINTMMVEFLFQFKMSSFTSKDSEKDIESKTKPPQGYINTRDAILLLLYALLSLNTPVRSNEDSINLILDFLTMKVYQDAFFNGLLQYQFGATLFPLDLIEELERRQCQQFESYKVLLEDKNLNKEHLESERKMMEDFLESPLGMEVKRMVEDLIVVPLLHTIHEHNQNKSRLHSRFLSLVPPDSYLEINRSCKEVARNSPKTQNPESFGGNTAPTSNSSISSIDDNGEAIYGVPPYPSLHNPFPYLHSQSLVARLVYGLIKGRERENLTSDDEELYLDLRRSKSSYPNYYNRKDRHLSKGNENSIDVQNNNMDVSNTQIATKKSRGGVGGFFGKVMNVVSTVASTALNAVMMKKCFPPEQKTLVIFMIGGISSHEVKEIGEILKENRRQRRHQNSVLKKERENFEVNGDTLSTGSKDSKSNQEEIVEPKVILISTTLSSPNSLHYHLFEDLARRDI